MGRNVDKSTALSRYGQDVINFFNIAYLTARREAVTTFFYQYLIPNGIYKYRIFKTIKIFCHILKKKIILNPKMHLPVFALCSFSEVVFVLNKKICLEKN